MEDFQIHLREIEQTNEKHRIEILKHEIVTGLQNLTVVKGIEYKKYIVYALFDYLLENKDDLQHLPATLASHIDIQLNKFIALSCDDSNHKFFHGACKYYKECLNSWLQTADPLIEASIKNL